MTDKKNKNRNRSRTTVRALLIASLVLVAVLATVAILMLPSFPKNGTAASQTTTPSQTTAATTKATEAAPEPALAGVTVNGVSIAGLMKAEALTATAQVPGTLLAKVAVSVTVDGVNVRLNAKDLGITTDYDAVMAQALAFGHTGTADERLQAAELAKAQGKAFTVRLVASREAVRAALQPLKDKVDKAPVNAGVLFMPSGYTADGKAYQPDPRKLADANAVGRSLDRPALVKVPASETPSPLRYQYWQTDHYNKTYIPADASISRFQYTPEANGRVLDAEALTDQIMGQISSGAFAPLTAATKAAEPTLKLAEAKKNTILISSWTSCYRTHSSTPRNWNVSRMSSFINGIVIQPGQSWSVNKTAGPRDAKTALTVGWKEAAGILNGGYTDQEGGGVCQLGSTTYNAVLRAGLTIVSSTHHTIPSDYVPLGMDATLSTPSPDLVVRNDSTVPYYLVSYVNPKDQNVTVEVYGPQPIDPKYGPVIYDYYSDNRGVRYGTPTVRYVYNATVAPDETILSPTNPVYVYAKPRQGTQIQTYKRIYDLTGKPLTDLIPFENHKYPMINGTTYVFGSTIVPTPAPTTTTTTAPTTTAPTTTAPTTTAPTTTTTTTTPPAG